MCFLFSQIYGLLCLKKKSHRSKIIKIINPGEVKLNKNEDISLESLKIKTPKCHQATYFMSKIGKFTSNILNYIIINIIKYK